jgi:2,3-bisphosphoglycerate-dependent phosphoglycerate mutase
VYYPHDNGQNFANPFSQRVLAFAHGGVINASVAEVLRLQKDFLFPTANTSIIIVRGSGKHRVLSVLNDIGQ